MSKKAYPKDYRTAFGNLIKHYRHKNWITQKALAAACNISRRQIIRWQNGQSMPPVDMVTEVFIALDIPIRVRLEFRAILDPRFRPQKFTGLHPD